MVGLVLACLENTLLNSTDALDSVLKKLVSGKNTAKLH